MQTTGRVIDEAEVFNGMLDVSNCSKIYLRYDWLNYWRGIAPTLTWTGNSLVGYIDGLAKKMKTGKPKIRFSFGSLTRGDQFESFRVKRLNKQIANYQILFNLTTSNATTYYTDLCLKITNLRIECTWYFNPSEEAFWLSKINYTLQFPAYKPAKRFFIYLIDMTSPDWNIEWEEIYFFRQNRITKNLF